MTRLSLFLLFFFFKECLNLVDAFIAFFFKDPIRVLLSSSEFSISDLRSFRSSWLEKPSKPLTSQRSYMLFINEERYVMEYA